MPYFFYGGKLVVVILMGNFNFKKKYGQNFLVDTNIVKKIVSDIDVSPKSLVIEIGCGDGRLTKFLCEKFDYVLGYEIDLEVKDKLLDNLKGFANYSIIFDDFLKRDVLADIKDISYDNVYVVANLPYYITTPIIERLVTLNLDISLMRFMVQKEVGDRFCALVGSKNYGSLTVYLNYNFKVKREFVVSRNSFYPRPNVDSMVVSFYPKERLVVKDIDLFYKLVRDSFCFKRKTLRNNLGSYDLDKVLRVLKRYGFDLSVRAEQLDEKIFCEISNELSI